MVEIFEQAEFEDLFYIRVWLGLSEPRGQIDRDLLIADRHFERAFVARNKPVHGFLLLLLDASPQRQHFFYFRIDRVARHVVRKYDGLDFDTVHDDAAAAAER